MGFQLTLYSPFGPFNLCTDLVNVLGQLSCLDFEWRLEAIHHPVSEHHQIPIVVSGAGKKALAGSTLQVISGDLKYSRRWEHLLGFSRDLPKHMVRYRNCRFVAHTDLFELYCDGYHFKGFTRTDTVSRHAVVTH